MIDLIEERGWILLNGGKYGDEEGEWTYEKAGKKSVIDYGIVNWEGWQRVAKFEVGCRVESDHQPLIFEIKNQYARQEEKGEEEGRVQDWSEEGVREYRKRMEEVEWKKEDKEVNEEWEEIEREITKAVKVRRKGKRRGIGWCPWWDIYIYIYKECQEKKRELNRARRKYRKEREEGYQEYVRCRREYRSLYEKKEEEYKKREEKEIENIKTEAEAWNFINRGRKKKEGVCKEIEMREWEKHFKEALGGVAEKKEITQRKKRSKKGEEGINQEEVNMEIKRLKKGKAAGLDGIRNEAWKEGGEKISIKVGRVIKRVWEGDGFPEKWRVGVVVPIWKRGDRKETANHRGVTLTSTGYKMYANILNKRLVKDLDEKGGWSRSQAGFRKGRGTVENIKILKHVIGKGMKKKERVYALFVDLKAAFDRLDRKILWEMMRKRKINEDLIQRVEEIYEETRCVVKIGEEVSKEFWVEKGVRQGCPLSPTLFNIYLADIEEELKKGRGGVKIGNDRVWSIEYADDIVLVADGEDGLRDMIRRFKKYLEEKKLEISTEKSKVMVFKNKGGREKERFWWWGKDRLEEVKKYKYLGYMMTRNGEDKEHIRERIRKARVAMGWIWSYGERKFKGDVRWRLKLFDSVVKGILYYGVEIWGYKEWKEIEAVQDKYLKWVLGLERTTPGYIVREELKRNKLRVETGWRAGRWEERIEKGEGGEIGKLCMMERRKEERKSEWIDWTRESVERRDYLWRGGVSEISLNEYGENKWDRVRERDIEVDEQERGEKVKKSRTCKNYERVNGIPEYIRRCGRKKGKKMVQIARWRCGNEERGNKYWMKEEDRKCRLCDMEREDIEHLKKNCEYVNEKGGRNLEVLNEDGRGYEWMRKIERLREEKDRKIGRERENK